MARYLGKEGSVKIGSNAIGEMKSFDVTLSREMAESIALGETWKANDYGDGSWSGSLSCHMDPDDTNGQVALNAAVIAGTKLTLNFYVEGTTTGDWELTGSALISEGGVSVSGNGDHTEASFSFTGDGAPTIGTAS